MESISVITIQCENQKAFCVEIVKFEIISNYYNASLNIDHRINSQFSSRNQQILLVTVKNRNYYIYQDGPRVLKGSNLDELYRRSFRAYMSWYKHKIKHFLMMIPEENISMYEIQMK